MRSTVSAAPRPQATPDERAPRCRRCQILLNNRAQVILRPSIPPAELLRDVCGQIGSAGIAVGTSINRRRMIPPRPGRHPSQYPTTVGPSAILSRARHHFSDHKPIISRRADKVSNEEQRARRWNWDIAFGFNGEDLLGFPISVFGSDEPRHHGAANAVEGEAAQAAPARSRLVRSSPSSALSRCLHRLDGDPVVPSD